LRRNVGNHRWWLGGRWGRGSVGNDWRWWPWGSRGWNIPDNRLSFERNDWFRVIITNLSGRRNVGNHRRWFWGCWGRRSVGNDWWWWPRSSRRWDVPDNRLSLERNDWFRVIITNLSGRRNVGNHRWWSWGCRGRRSVGNGWWWSNGSRSYVRDHRLGFKRNNWLGIIIANLRGRRNVGNYWWWWRRCVGNNRRKLGSCWRWDIPNYRLCFYERNYRLRIVISYLWWRGLYLDDWYRGLWEGNDGLRVVIALFNLSDDQVRWHPDLRLRVAVALKLWGRRWWWWRWRRHNLRGDLDLFEVDGRLRI